MNTVLRGGKIYTNGALADNVSLEVEHADDTETKRVIELDNSFILPSLCDVHVHFREPGFELFCRVVLRRLTVDIRWWQPCRT